LEFMPCLTHARAGGEVRSITLGHRLLDDYLAFVAARARTNTWLATAYDLKARGRIPTRTRFAVRASHCYAATRPWPGCADREGPASHDQLAEPTRGHLRHRNSVHRDSRIRFLETGARL
jgi:hypothetical protein